MPDCRRMILKPPGAEPKAVAQLAAALGEAINLQNRLAAKSPYVLRFTGPLEQDEAAFWVAHEPATPLVAASPYEAGPGIPPEQFVSLTSGLFSALAVAADASGGAPPIVHGGICPGVLLRGADGLVKISDFGFAPALCRSLLVDAYLNLALAVQADSTGTWEVLTEDDSDRDDRLCGFVDPEKYGLDMLDSFEPGSDTIAAGMTLYLLAEGRHPYLCVDPVAHRFVEIARMMGSWSPAPFTRKDLTDAASPAIKTCCKLVADALKRLPSQRPAAAEMARRLEAGGLATDELLNAQRWVGQVEVLLGAKAWHDLEELLKSPPPLKVWPPDLRARADEVERQVRAYVAERGRQGAIEAEHRKADDWFAHVQRVFAAEDWKATQKLLSAKPALEHWPARIPTKLDAIAARVEQELVTEEARNWARALQRAFEAREWSAVKRRLTQPPPPASCPAEVRELIAQVQAEYERHLEKEQQKQDELELQYEQARQWLARAKAHAEHGEWTEALEVLHEPPPREHQPAEVREEARQLDKACKLRQGEKIAGALPEIEAGVCRQGEAAVRAEVSQRFAGLVHPECVHATGEMVIWAPPGSDAHGRIPLSVCVQPAQGSTGAEPVRGDVDFNLKGTAPHVVGGLDVLRRRVAEGLPRQIVHLQNEQLRTLEHSLHDSVFPHAAVRTEITQPSAAESAPVRLLGASVAEGELSVDLRWNDRNLAWEVRDRAGFVRRAREIAETVTQRVILETLLARSATLRPYERLLRVSATPGPEATETDLPKSLAFAIQIIGVGPAANGAVPLRAGDATTTEAGWARFGASLEELEAEFADSLAPLQNRSRDEVLKRVQEWAAAAPSVQVVAPKRAKGLEDQIRIELRLKGGRRVDVDATWNAQELRYDLPADWEALASATPAETRAP